MTSDKQQVVMIVGADMCGKTQIAKALASITGIPYFKSSDEHESYLDKKHRFINDLRYADPRAFDLVKQMGMSVVFDRAYPCEWVYSTVMRRKTDHVMLHVMDERWASLGTKIIICGRSNYVGIVDDIDDKINAEMLVKLDAEYKNFATWTKCEVLMLNVDDENLDREVDEVLHFMNYNKTTRQFMVSQLKKDK